MNDQEDSPQGVAALDRAIAILKAFTPEDDTLSLAELATRTGFYKSTILRLVASLLRGGMLERLQDGQYRVGPALFALGSLYQRSIAAADVLLPIMHGLSERTGESVAFYVRSDDLRTCLYRVESRHAIRHIVREGDVLPLDEGSGGRVLMAFSGAEGTLYDTIRREHVYMAVGERDPETSGISAPVFGPGRRLVGALTVAGPRSRIDETALRRMRQPLLDAAARATRAFGEDAPQLQHAG